MLEKPHYWNKFYPSQGAEAKLFRAYSYSDRIRYYWPEDEIKQTVETLFENLEGQIIPQTLLSQFMPMQYKALTKGQINSSPRELVLNKIMEVTNSYSLACNQ